MTPEDPLDELVRGAFGFLEQNRATTTAESDAIYRDMQRVLDRLAHLDTITAAIGDHTPSGHEDMSGYGQVSCSCGEWESSNDYQKGYPTWAEHILQGRDPA